MVDEGYATSTIYQTRNALFNMLDYAYQNDVIIKNPCNKVVKSDIVKTSKKKEALTIAAQRMFCKIMVGILMSINTDFFYRQDFVQERWLDLNGQM